MLRFNPGDVFFAYLKRHGFVGVGVIRAKAAMINHVRIHGKPLLSLPLRCQKMDDHCENPQLSEYVCLVKWKSTVPRHKAIWRSKPKLFTTTSVRASLDRHKETVTFLERKFHIKVKNLIA